MGRQEIGTRRVDLVSSEKCCRHVIVKLSPSDDLEILQSPEDLLQNVSLTSLVLTDDKHLYNIEIWLWLQQYYLKCCHEQKWWQCLGQSKQRTSSGNQTETSIQGFQYPAMEPPLCKALLFSEVLICWPTEFSYYFSACFPTVSSVCPGPSVLVASELNLAGSLCIHSDFSYNLDYQHFQTHRCLRASYSFSIPSLASSSSNMISIIANIHHVSATKLILGAL